MPFRNLVRLLAASLVTFHTLDLCGTGRKEQKKYKIFDVVATKSLLPASSFLSTGGPKDVRRGGGDLAVWGVGGEKRVESAGLFTLSVSRHLYVIGV